MPFEIVLFEPEIPPNTGSIMRLCTNAGCSLHLIEPLGFELDDRRLRRAGLDYADYRDVQTHANWAAYRDDLAARLNGERGARIWAFSTRGRRRFTEARFEPGDVLLFGPETRGLPNELLEACGERTLRLPMRENSRSLNLSNAAAVAVYEGWRQLGFEGASR
ncbi:MAG: tRNA (cytidine(34)-2'-O)-methyltransferase [Pseudomonadota bacterium]